MEESVDTWEDYCNFSVNFFLLGMNGWMDGGRKAGRYVVTYERGRVLLKVEDWESLASGRGSINTERRCFSWSLVECQTSGWLETFPLFPAALRICLFIMIQTETFRYFCFLIWILVRQTPRVLGAALVCDTVSMCSWRHLLLLDGWQSKCWFYSLLGMTRRNKG